jgi:hypothetical protein
VKKGFPNQLGADSNCLPEVGAGRHVKAVSLDLRVRVLAAVKAGASHRMAGARFWDERGKCEQLANPRTPVGDARPKALGGDRRSGRIEAHKDTILAMLKETPDAAIEELRRNLAQKGLVFGEGTIRRFLTRHGITRKKRLRTPAIGPAGCGETAAVLARWRARS